MALWLQMYVLPGFNVDITGPCHNFRLSLSWIEKALPNIKKEAEFWKILQYFRGQRGLEAVLFHIFSFISLLLATEILCRVPSTLASLPKVSGLKSRPELLLSWLGFFLALCRRFRQMPCSNAGLSSASFGGHSEENSVCKGNFVNYSVLCV